MPAMSAEPLPDPVGLRGALAALEVPPGFRAEPVDGESSVSPPPDGRHGTVVVAVDDRVRDVHGPRLHRTLTLISAEGGHVPDGIAAPKGTFAGRDRRSEPEGALMVPGVTSEDVRGLKGAERDRGPQRRGYAAADIPPYLLVDRRKARPWSSLSLATATTPAAPPSWSEGPGRSGAAGGRAADGRVASGSLSVSG